MGPGPTAIALVLTAGGLAPAALLVALVALRSPYRAVTAVGRSIVAGYGVLGLRAGRLHPHVFSWVFFEALSLLFFGAMLAVACRLLVRRSPTRAHYGVAGQDDWFLATWFALEIVGYFASHRSRPLDASSGSSSPGHSCGRSAGITDLPIAATNGFGSPRGDRRGGHRPVLLCHRLL